MSAGAPSRIVPRSVNPATRGGQRRQPPVRLLEGAASRARARLDERLGRVPAGGEELRVRAAVGDAGERRRGRRRSPVRCDRADVRRVGEEDASPGRSATAMSSIASTGCLPVAAADVADGVVSATASSRRVRGAEDDDVLDRAGGRRTAGRACSAGAPRRVGELAPAAPRASPSWPRTRPRRRRTGSSPRSVKVKPASVVTALAVDRGCRARGSAPATSSVSRCDVGPVVEGLDHVVDHRPAADLGQLLEDSACRCSWSPDDHRHLDEALVALGQHLGEHAAGLVVHDVGDHRRAVVVALHRRAGPTAAAAAPTSRTPPASIASCSRRRISSCSASVGSTPGLGRSSKPSTQTSSGADGHVGQEVDRLGRRARRCRGTRGSVTQSHGMPACIDVVAGSPRRASSTASPARGSPGRTGAKPKPQLPITTDVTPCQPDSVQYGSQKSCAS